MTSRDERLQSLFAAAVEMDASTRERLLEALRAEDPALHAELVALLAADPAELPGLAGRADASESLPSKIGPYAILGTVGEGGMGVVYRAKEGGPLGRIVAVKVLRPELSATSAIGRFEAEREALALMDHPNVARVFDAGRTANGRMYIAMEFVDGTPITAYCDARRLDLAERLSLFLQVCDGVQHAHERGVIHRDLNPTNVLVAEIDGRPVAKIIDFGIAKLARTPGGPQGPRTEAGILVGTPEYMSPEQVSMTPGAGDTRTDVWALGLLAYELLVGLLPYDAELLGRSGLTGLRTAILEQPIPSPATRIRALDAKRAEAIARNRRIDARALARAVRGDLSRVVLKAIERDRARRYASPHELAADVRRYLRLEPVQAGSPGIGYRSLCFVRRHRRAVAAATVAIAVAGSAAIAAGIQARLALEQTERARRESAMAAELSAFVVDFMTPPSSVAQRNDRVDAEAILGEGTRRVVHALEGKPVLRAQLLHAFGDAQRRLGRFSAAEPLLAEAVTSLEDDPGPDLPETLAAKDSLARLRQDAGSFDSAETLFRETYEARRRVLGAYDPETLRALSRLGFFYFRANRAEDADALLARCVEGMRRALGPDDPETIVTTAYRVGTLLRIGRAGEALVLVDDLLPRAREVLGSRHVETLGAEYNRACALSRLGSIEEAIAALRSCVDDGFFLGAPLEEDPDLVPLRSHPAFAEIARDGDMNHPGTWSVVYSDAWRMRREGRLDRAEALLHELGRAARRCRAEGLDTLDNELLLADVLILDGRTADAEPIVARLDDLVVRAGPLAPYPPAEFAALRAQCRLGHGDREGAMRWLDEAKARIGSATHTGVAAYVESRRSALSGDADGARRWLAEARARGYLVWWWKARDEAIGEP